MKFMEKVEAKDLYCRNGVHGEADVRLLNALNNISDGLNYLLSFGRWESVTNALESSANTVAERCNDIYGFDELMEILINFETIRTMLLGDKIDYKKLLKVLNDGVCGDGYSDELTGIGTDEQDENK